LQRKIKRDDRLQTGLTRVRDFGVSVSQCTNPLAGYLAGVLFLRRKITADELGRFYSFLDMTPSWVRGIEYRDHVQTNNYDRAYTIVTKRYRRLIKELGPSIAYLHELAQDRLVCSINTLKATLAVVPLTSSGYAFSIAAETQRPRSHRKKRDPARTSSSKSNVIRPDRTVV